MVKQAMAERHADSNIWPSNFRNIARTGTAFSKGIHTLNNVDSLEGTFQNYYHATPGEPLQGSPGVAW